MRQNFIPANLDYVITMLHFLRVLTEKKLVSLNSVQEFFEIDA